MITPLIIGHRGASAVAPENTMAAFREAIAAGSDGIEFDVRLTRDGIPVVIHDSSLRRTSGLSQRVADLTWAEIRSVNVGSWFAQRQGLAPGTFAGETVPSLEELFELFQSNDLKLYLEMKCDSMAEYRPLAKACCELIEAQRLKARVMIECFQLEALRIVKEIDSEIQNVALFEPTVTDPSLLLDRSILNKATEIGASALALHHRLARKSLVEKAKVASVHVAVWTVDDPNWVEKARALGIDALITNDPVTLIQARNL